MKIHFVAGLPRSGSTLLVNILGQNPRFQVTGTSPLLPALLGARQFLDDQDMFKAWPSKAKHKAKLGMLQGAVEGFYTYTDKPVIIDKNRGWPAHIEMVEEALGISPKIVCTVRDIRDILASFEKLYRKNKGQRLVPGEKENPFRFQTVAERCGSWTENAQPVGYAYNALKDAFDRGKGNCLHIVEFDQLTSEPQKVFDGIYQFLGEDPYRHDFTNVEQITQEDDQWHGYEDLHTIRTKVAPVPPQWPDILPAEVAKKYGTPALHFWRKDAGKA